MLCQCLWTIDTLLKYFLYKYLCPGWYFIIIDSLIIYSIEMHRRCNLRSRLNKNLIRNNLKVNRTPSGQVI